MILFQKAKRLGAWDPFSISLLTDIAAWPRLGDRDRHFISRMVGMFVAGEERVTRELLPVLGAVSDRGWLEDEIFLTAFLWEEAKHAEFFHRWFSEVPGTPPLRADELVPSYRELSERMLPGALQALKESGSDEALVAAVTTYCVVFEGGVGEAGFSVFRRTLAEEAAIVGLRGAVGMVAADESRHVAYGVYLLRRLLSADPSLHVVVRRVLADAVPVARAIPSEMWAKYEQGTTPFGVDRSAFLADTERDFQRRLRALERILARPSG
jgi:ribonucleoside-diphosphate reductase beta chain